VRPLAIAHRHTFADYLDLEAASNVRHEYLGGEIYAMAGGSPEHAALCLAVGAELRARLGDGPCRAFSADLRIRVLASGLATYVACEIPVDDLYRGILPAEPRRP
jgi:Uma2 family endonuclease